MKKILIISVMALAILSCTSPKAASTTLSLQGVWDRMGTISFENGKAIDTFPFDGKSKQVKFFSAEHFIFVSNGERLDSLGVDQNIGFAGNGKYEVKNDSLFEYMSHGTDNYLRWIEGTDKIYKVKINLSENHYTQYWLDSLGNGRGELYERME